MRVGEPSAAREPLVEPRWDDARAALAQAVRPLAPVRLPLEQADGLVLAEDLVARVALPSFDTSAMDGWAVSGPGPWRVVGTSLAGRPWSGHLGVGEAVTIATGAVVPTGSHAVVRSEDGVLDDGEVATGAAPVLSAELPEAGLHVRPSGEECRAGDVLAGAGSPVTPAWIGLAAAAGHDTLLVVPRPRVALVLFGDELALSGVPGPGLVRDSLGPQVPAWVRRMGAEVVLVERGEDTLEAHVAAIQRAAGLADVVLTTGGTAAGPVDHLHAAIAACGGTVVIDSVAVRPGHPMLAASLDDGATWLVGLPGNPQSAIVTLVSLAAPVLAGLAGRPALPDLGMVVATEAIGAPAHEDRLVLGTLGDAGFTPGSHLGSGMLRGLAGATGFAVLPPGGVRAGDPVRWLPLPA
jgi:molybdopterin molybdotransferase